MLDRTKVAEMLDKLYFASGANEFFDPPQMKVAAAADPFFQRFKTVIGDFHWTPEEVLPGAASVICWVLPVRSDAREANRREKQRPAVLWARVRSFGELANEAMRRQLCRCLQEKGSQAVAPHLRQMEQHFDMVKMGFTSHWSERHAAFVAGLGTFGLSAGLITEHGVAARFGSVVTTLPLSADVRPYGDDPFAWCTKCGACARRCPGQAIGPDFSDRDKPKCARYCVEHVTPNRLENYGWLDLSLGCGLCQTGVPCEFKRPGR